jgi:hypothetical protein
MEEESKDMLWKMGLKLLQPCADRHYEESASRVFYDKIQIDLASVSNMHL